MSPRRRSSLDALFCHAPGRFRAPSGVPIDSGFQVMPYMPVLPKFGVSIFGEMINASGMRNEGEMRTSVETDPTPASPVPGGQVA